MRHYYNSEVDINNIVTGITVEGNNPIVKDVISLVRLWSSDKNGARKLLSYEYDFRNNNGNILCDIEYDSTGNYTIAGISLGRGCVSTDIIGAKLSLNYSSILNLASTKIDIWTEGTVAMTDVLGVIAKMNFEGSFQLREYNHLELSMRNVNINQAMNCLKSLETSFEQRNYKAVNASW